MIIESKDLEWWNNFNSNLLVQIYYILVLIKIILFLIINMK
jgi:hypothetical protein